MASGVARLSNGDQEPEDVVWAGLPTSCPDDLAKVAEMQWPLSRSERFSAEEERERIGTYITGMMNASLHGLRLTANLWNTH